MNFRIAAGSFSCPDITKDRCVNVAIFIEEMHIQPFDPPVSSINIGYFSTRKINDARIYLSDTFTGNLRNLVGYGLQQKLIYKTLIVNDLIVQELQDESKKGIDPLKYDPAGVKVVK